MSCARRAPCAPDLPNVPSLRACQHPCAQAPCTTRTARHIRFLLYPGLCLRLVKLCKYTLLVIDGEERQYLTEDMRVPYREVRDTQSHAVP